jgi:outer membrane protein assembly factor BamB
MAAIIASLVCFMRDIDLTLHALALSTGQRKWALKVNGSAWGTAIQDGVVYAGDLGVHAIDAISGKKLWSFKGTGRESAQLISGGRVYASSPTITYVGMKRVDQGFLCAVDAKTGKTKP